MSNSRAPAVAARQGAKVVVGDVSDEGAATIDLIKQERGEAVFVRTSVANAAEVEALVQQTMHAYGALSCAFNNAGILPPTLPLAEQEKSTFDKVFAGDLKGVSLYPPHGTRGRRRHRQHGIDRGRHRGPRHGAILRGEAWCDRAHGVSFEGYANPKWNGCGGRVPVAVVSPQRAEITFAPRRSLGARKHGNPGPYERMPMTSTWHSGCTGCW